MENRPLQLKHLYNCREITTRLAIGSTERSWKERWILRFHLTLCWFCRRYERQLKIIGSALRLSVDHHMKGKDVTSLKARILDEFRRS